MNKKISKKRIKKITSILLVMVVVATGIFSKSYYGTAKQSTNDIAYSIAANANKWLGDSTHKFSSSQDGKTQAIKVDEGYGYKFFQTPETKVSVVQGKAETAPETYNDKNLGLTSFEKEMKWFQTSKNTAGSISVKVSNLKIYQPEQKKYIVVDVVRTITKIDKYNSQEGWVALGSGLSDTVYVGIEEVTTQNIFYAAGTSNKLKLRTNITLTDIDANQYVMVKADNIANQYVSANTNLWYAEINGYAFYGDTTGTNFPDSDNDVRTHVAFTFEGNSFTYVFGRDIDKPTRQDQYIGTGQDMFIVPPATPMKTVANVNGERTTHNDIPGLVKGWSYYVEQPMVTDVPKEFYYDRFIFEDEIEECLEVTGISVSATDKNGKDSDATSLFDISKENNHIKATLKNPKTDSVYQKVSYILKIDVKWRTPKDLSENNVYMEKWKKHGHYNSKQTMLTVENEAKVTIDEWINPTNKVTTDTHLSTDDSENPGLAIVKDVNIYENQVNDIFRYTVKVWNTNEKADTAYFKIYDTTLSDTVQLDYSTVTVEGISKENYTIEQSGNGWILESVGDYALPYGKVITITYDAKGLVEGNGTVADNTAKTAALGIPEKLDNAQIYINSPKLDVVKTAPKQNYKIGDTVPYTVVITNRNPGTFMRNIVLKDDIATEGMIIKEGTIKVFNGDTDVTEEVEIVMEEEAEGFTINTPINLKNSDIPCIGKKSYSDMRNWSDKITVTYDTKITEKAGVSLDNIFTAPPTPNTNGIPIKEDSDIPSGGGADDESVVVVEEITTVQETTIAETTTIVVEETTVPATTEENKVKETTKPATPLKKLSTISPKMGYTVWGLLNIIMISGLGMIIACKNKEKVK